MRLSRNYDGYGVEDGINKYVYVLCCLTKFDAWATIGRKLGNIGILTGDNVGYRRVLSRGLETIEKSLALGSLNSKGVPPSGGHGQRKKALVGGGPEQVLTLTGDSLERSTNPSLKSKLNWQPTQRIEENGDALDG